MTEVKKKMVRIIDGYLSRKTQGRGHNVRYKTHYPGNVSKDFRDWWLVKSRGRIHLGDLYLDQKHIGKRIRLSVCVEPLE